MWIYRPRESHKLETVGSTPISATKFTVRKSEEQMEEKTDDASNHSVDSVVRRWLVGLS